MIDEKILIERLEETRWTTIFDTTCIFENDKLDKCIKIVNQLAEESNNGWIPCSERLPVIGTLVLATTESGNVCDDVLIYDYEHSKSNEPCFHRWDDEMWECYTPRVIAWQPLPAPYKPGE